MVGRPDRGRRRGGCVVARDIGLGAAGRADSCACVATDGLAGSGSPISVGFAEPLLHSEDAEADEARAAAANILNDLMAGIQPDEQSVLQPKSRLKGYRSCWIVSQQRDGAAPSSWHFEGTLTGGDGNAAFGISLVKQQSGKWMASSFCGPDRQ
jgi:hypothetical protein